jgi:phospholipid transport system transporter-binding protein
MATLVLPATLTHAEATGCGRMLAQAVRASGDAQAVADAAALVRFDSSALAVLLECRREALASGKAFSVRGMPERLRSLASLYGVSELLPG